MDKNKNDLIENWFSMLLGLLAVVAIKSIFENDGSKIVSKKGKKMLSDDDKMKELNEKIQQSETNKNHNEIFI